ncbi:MAG TPA: hypothetical protein VJ969_04625 [Desulfopila sp.]|nr:hypothetical protein [Desulfopila sp.]
MTKQDIIVGILTLLVVLYQALSVFAYERKSRVVTLRCASMEVLRQTLTSYCFDLISNRKII